MESSFTDSPMPPPSQNVVHTWRSPVHLLPAEILSIIFRLVVDDGDGDDDGEVYDDDRVVLMLVCRHWHDIMLSTPGILFILWIQTSTTMEMVRAAIQGTTWLLRVTIAIDDNSTEQDFNADGIDECSKAAIEVASRCKSLLFHSFPLPREWKAFQIVHPLKSLESSCLSQGCDIGGFIGLLMTAITTTTTPRLTQITLYDLNAVLYLVQPDCLPVFCSLTNLIIWLSERMESPANILPHLPRLESFHARHLYLPIYPPGAPLALIQTLRDLTLISVSVQWMAGRVFPVLQACSISFPHQIDAICLHPVIFPACTSLGYDSNDLGPLGSFHDLPLAELTVKCGQWNATRGNLQLIAVCHMIVPRAQSLTKLDIQVRCSEKLLTCMLSLLPALKALKLGLASPRALSETFFQAFVAINFNVDNPSELGGLPSLPLCLELEQLEVYYKRWLRGPERMTILPLVFSTIVSSRRAKEHFQLLLGFEGLAQQWILSKHVERIHEIFIYEPLVVGISSPYGIIPLIMFEEDDSTDDPLMEVPFKEVEYLVAHRQLSINCLLTLHHLVELRVRGQKDILPSEPPPNLPLFHTLRVFEAEEIRGSYVTGQVFYKLEKCRMRMILYGQGPMLSENQVTQMPVCTRLDVDDLTLLAALKLPRICELGVSIGHQEFNMIWEKHIAVNVNLSGLELLHVHGWYQQVDLVQALRCLPVLKSLILTNCSDLGAAFFGELLSMHPDENALPIHSHDEGQISPILCPMLSSILTEDWDPTEQVELIPVLKQVVTLRSTCCFPSKQFTLSAITYRGKFRLIGSQGSLETEMDSMDEYAEAFSLEI